MGGPKWKKDLAVGIAYRSAPESVPFLIGCIVGIPMTAVLRGEKREILVTDLLCVAPRFRKRHMATKLIGELDRRGRALGFTGAIGTRGDGHHGYASTREYNVRPLNFIRASKLGYWRKKPGVPFSTYVKLYSLKKLDESLGTGGILRAMEKKDVPAICDMLNGYLKRYELAPYFSPEDCEHMLLPRDGIISSYLSEDGFISWRRVVTEDGLVSAYVYYAAPGMGMTPDGMGSLYRILVKALTKMEEEKVDMCACLSSILPIPSGLRFQVGTNLYFYTRELGSSPCSVSMMII